MTEQSLKSEVTKNLIVDLQSQGLSNRAIGRELGLPESTIRYFLNKQTHKAWWDTKEVVGADTHPDHPKILFLDLEVSASIVAAFSMFKHFSTPDHIIEFPYVLTYAVNWLHDDEDSIYCKGLDDYEGFEQDHKNDYLLMWDLWHYLDAADIVVIQNSSFDDGWMAQRFAYHGIPQPSPYRLLCTLKGLKKAMSLPSNSLGYSTKYFNLGVEKLHHEGISLWIGCMKGDVESFGKMKTYNIGDIPTLRDLYLTIRAYIPNHPNLSVYYNDGALRCGVCGGDHLEKLETPAYTNLGRYDSYRCIDCGTVRRLGVNQTTKNDRINYTRTIIR